MYIDIYTFYIHYANLHGFHLHIYTHIVKIVYDQINNISIILVPKIAACLYLQYTYPVVNILIGNWQVNS